MRLEIVICPWYIIRAAADIGSFVAPRPPRAPPGGTPNPPAPRGRRMEGNRVQRGVGSPRCGRAAAVARGVRGGLTPQWGPRRAGALHGPRRHLRGSGELRGAFGGGIWASPGAPLRRYPPLEVGAPISYMDHPIYGGYMSTPTKRCCWIVLREKIVTLLIMTTE
jgi:hypothetical protein